MLLWIKNNDELCGLYTKNITSLNDIKMLEKNYNINILKELKTQGEQSIKKWSVTGIGFIIVFVFLFLILNNNEKLLLLPVIAAVLASITYHNCDITNEIDRMKNLKNNCLLLK